MAEGEEDLFEIRISIFGFSELLLVIGSNALILASTDLIPLRNER